MLPPPITPLEDLDAVLRTRGYAVLDTPGLCALVPASLGELDALAPSWNRLPADAYLLDGGRYRYRRHACYVVEEGKVTPAPRRAHWQPVAYNALHGGIERWFEPVEDGTQAAPAWLRLIAALGERASRLRGAQRWHVEAHQFRIDTTDGIGRPTPEGAHRDGVDLVVVIVLAREGIKGGETRVFEAEGPHGIRFTLAQPWSALLLDDSRVIHETTPIQPLRPDVPGHRDTLVLTFRAHGFQGPAPLVSETAAG